jgi:peptide/nickel transport system substrate-binding protein/oligopeptide transport system substrate-binding protein
LSPDGRTYTFKLRKGVKFHDGRDVKSSDVVFSLGRGLDVKLGSGVVPLLDTIKGAGDFLAGKSTAISGLAAPDPRTVVITLERPFVPFLAALASVAGSITPRDIYSDPNRGYLNHPVGCGPFKFESWDHGVDVKLAAFPGYWKGRPGIPGIDVRIIPHISTALEEFKTDGLDFDNESPTGQRSLVRQDFKDEYLVWPRVATAFIAFNHAQAPFKGNPTLRRALNFAVDRERIAHVLQEDKDVATSRLLPPGLLGHNPAPGPYRYNPGEAKRLLAEAGYPDGKGLPELTFITSDNEAIKRFVESIQADFLEIGVNVRIKSMDFGSYGHALTGTKENGADGSLFMLLWYPDLPDPDGFLGPILRSTNFGDLGNYSRYSNAEVDRLLDDGRAELDPGRREAIYRKLEDVALADACLIPLYFQRDDALLKRRIRGFVTNPLGDFATHLELLHIGP